ncbi:MAG: hypothetical protein SFV51_01075 [Bryobacteraceae bacterium]|nr:hypothetical protein [Bryobacteraceae bacterium]
MRLFPTTLVLAAAIPLAHGQTFAQPVREVDRDARASLHGSCTVGVVPGGSDATGLCSFTGPDGASRPGPPQGKFLVLEEASATCTRASGDGLASLAIGNTLGQSLRFLPLSTQGTENGFTRMAAFTYGRTYYRPLQSITARLRLAAFATQHASCFVLFSGHLVDAQ